MLRDRPRAHALQQRNPGRLPFLESSLRILPARTQRFGDGTHQGVETLAWAGLPQGRLCRQPADAARGALARLRTCTDCSGNGLGDKLAHRVEIQAPQPRPHAGTGNRRSGGPPPIGLAPEQQALIRTLGRRPDRLVQLPGSARRGAQSLINYWAAADRYVFQRIPIRAESIATTGRWASVGVGGSRLRGCTAPSSARPRLDGW